jgi:hypothetical protein
MNYDFMGNALNQPSVMDMILSAPSLMTMSFIALCAVVGLALWKRA